MSSKTALITGASAGLGRATAIGLAELGYQLVLFARREEKLIELKQQLHVPTHIVVCDVTDQAAVSDALESLPIEFQNIDVLINNAGLALGLE
ncbi:MAG: 3-hydroxy acid dehydrogenase/malonic semialdehyde reductase, partial [Cryomorphaceae bacterium]